MTNAVRQRESMPSADEPSTKRRRSNSPNAVVVGEGFVANADLLKQLPPTMFSRILTFLGPTSQSLIEISALSKKWHRTMAAIGTTMQSRAQLHFRKPLMPKCSTESAISLFVRHTRLYAKVQADLELLGGVVRKSLCDLDSELASKALSISLDLLEVSPALSLDLEQLILSTCGKCGGKIFKYCKLENNANAGDDSKSSNNQLAMSQWIMKTVIDQCQRASKIEPSSNIFIRNNNKGQQGIQTTGCH